MTSEDEMVNAVLCAWAAAQTHAGADGNGDPLAMARAAVHAVTHTCGVQHPARTGVVCTSSPHDDGPMWHRNDRMKLEWDPVTGDTVHDDLGRITLDQPILTPTMDPGFAEVVAADHQIYRCLLEVLDSACRELTEIAAAYRDGRNMTARRCRLAEKKAALCTEAMTLIRELIGDSQ